MRNVTHEFSGSDRSRWLQTVAVVAVVALAALVNIPQPLHGDAALYQMGARAMSRGGALYRDYWDLKQPGIYIFHWLAGTLFGFTEIGLHLFEALWLLVLVAGQSLLLRRHFSPQWLATIVPIASIGVYYGIATEWHLTQPAILLSLPVFIVLIVAGNRGSGSIARWVIAGAAAATAIAFKFIMAPVVLALIFAGAVASRELDEESWASIARRRLLPAVLGAIGVAVALLGWLAINHSLGAFIWTNIEWRPLAIIERGPHPLVRLGDSTAWFSRRFAPWMLLSLFAPIGWRGRAEERIFLMAGIWLIAGVTTIWIEPFAGWEFDFLVLVVPLGMLATRGLQGLLVVLDRAAVLADTRYSPWVPVMLVLVIVAGAGLPSGRSWASKVHALSRFEAGDSTHIDDHAMQRALSPRYRSLWNETAFLRDSIEPPGPIYVFGDPLVLFLSHRQQASSINGWAWELQPDVIWARVEGELISRKPPFIYTEQLYDSMITLRAPALRQTLDSAYTVRTRDTVGTWYARRAESSSTTHD